MMLAGPERAVGCRIHKATVDDIPLFIELAAERYPDRQTHRGIPWICWAIQQPTYCCLAGDNAVGVAAITDRYAYERVLAALMLTARPGAGWEAYRIVKAMTEFGKARGATEFRLDADTGFDLGPFARRLGGYEIKRPRYAIPLGGPKQ